LLADAASKGRKRGGGVITWVTGGGTGIGRALAEALYREGHRVAISGRRESMLAEVVRSCSSLSGHGEIWPLAGDVGDAPTVARLANSLRERWGSVDLLINNAGFNINHSFSDSTPEEFIDLFRINCLSAVLCARAVLPGMLAQKRGTIVNVSSIFGRWASAKSAAYSVSKYALAGFNDALRQELAGTGIHVMGVYPGFINTAMTASAGESESWRRWLGRSPEAMAEAILRGVRRHAREVSYPWYVAWGLRFHRWFPETAESLRRRIQP
jgi:hypothetical protein